MIDVRRLKLDVELSVFLERCSLVLYLVAQLERDSISRSRRNST
jgi:hypothetical protein